MGTEQFAAIMFCVLTGAYAAVVAITDHRPSVWMAAGAFWLLAFIGWLNRPKGRRG